MLSSVLSLVRPLIILDFETCREINPERNRAVSLGFKRHRPDGKVDRYKTLINPGFPIDPDSMRVHGVTNQIIEQGCARCWKTREEHPVPGPIVHGNPTLPICEEWKPIPKFADIAPRLATGFVGGEVDFGGQHVLYDLDVLTLEFALVGVTFNYKTSYILDTLRIEQILEPRDLATLYKKYTGEELEGAHDALTDVEASEMVLHGQLTKHAHSGMLPRSVPELGLLCYQPKVRQPNWVDADGKFIWKDGQVCFNFGDHRGKPIKTQRGYLNWIVTKAEKFSPEVKQISRDAMAGIFPTPPGVVAPPPEGLPF